MFKKLYKVWILFTAIKISFISDGSNTYLKGKIIRIYTKAIFTVYNKFELLYKKINLLWFRLGDFNAVENSVVK